MEHLLKVKPYSHQRDAYNAAKGRSAFAFLAEQGTGKTIMAIATLGDLYADGQIHRAIVVCPKSVLSVWEREFAKHAAFPVSVCTLDRGASRSVKNLYEFSELPFDGLKVAVVNYDSVWRMDAAWEKFPPDAIICDESQRIKNPFTRQSKYLHALARRARYRYILTGTPVTQGPLDFWSQYRFLAPNILPFSYYAFRNRYAVMGGWENKQVVGYRNLGELTQRVHSIAYRVTKADALDLPPQVFQERYCEMPPYAKGIYKRLAREDMALIEGGQISASNVLTRLLRYSQLTGGHVTTDEGDTKRVHDAKLDTLFEVIDETAGKLVVFCRFIPEIRAILERLDKEGIPREAIWGEVTSRERAEAIERFQTDPERKVFVAQLQAAGLGITLTAASTAVFYSLNYSYADYEQCCARIHRIGQDQKCTYIHLIAEGTIDEDVLDILKRKGSMANLVVDEWKKLLKRGV